MTKSIALGVRGLSVGPHGLGLGGANSLLDNLAWYWPSDEASGAWLDAHTLGFDAPETNPPILTATGLVYPTARTLDVSEAQKFQVGGPWWLELGGLDFTFGIWFRRTVAVGSGKRLVLYQCEPGGIFDAGAWGTHDNFAVTDSVGTVFDVQTASGSGQDVWACLIGWYDDIAKRPYVQVNNGTVYEGPQLSNPVRSLSGGWAYFTVGHSPGRGFVGELGPCAFWKSAPGGGGVLSAANRAAWYNNGLGLRYDQLNSGAAPYIIFDGTANGDCGSDATLDDLHGATFQVEVWIKATGSAMGMVIDKGGAYAQDKGWAFHGSTGSQFSANLRFSGGIISVGSDNHAELVGVMQHVLMSYDGTARTAKFAINGKWQTGTSGVSSGTPSSDAAEVLRLGAYSPNGTSWPFSGEMGWIRISDNLRYTPGTDFIPPARATPPPTDGNTVLLYNVDEGEGDSVYDLSANENHAELTNVEWGGPRPIAPYLTFDGIDTAVDCGSGVTIDDLPEGANGFTAEGYFYVKAVSSGYEFFFTKGEHLQQMVFSGGTHRAMLEYSGGQINASKVLPFGQWYHIAWTFDENTDGQIRMFIDGIYQLAGPVASGTYEGDAASTLYLGRDEAGSTLKFEGNLGWFRLSDTKRYADGVDFVPPPRNHPPPSDGDTVLLYNVDEGEGTTLEDLSGNGNDGTITNGTWGEG